MVLTLILSIEFSLLRLAQIPWPVVVAVLGWAVLPMTLSLVFFRYVWFGATRENGIAMIVCGLLVVSLSIQYGHYLDMTIFILIVAFAASHLAIGQLAGRKRLGSIPVG